MEPLYGSCHGGETSGHGAQDFAQPGDALEELEADLSEHEGVGREGRGGFMGTYVADRYASELGLSVGQGPTAKLYPFDILLEKPVVNDVVGPYPILVVMDPVNKQAMAFSAGCLTVC